MKNFYITLLFILSIYSVTPATTRFVSKTGTSTPPYTTWTTASDSIQKCINICNNGDTIIVGNGVYKEHLRIYIDLTIIGMSPDSTIIDGRGINLHDPDSLGTLSVKQNFEIRNFHIYGHMARIIDGFNSNGRIIVINNIMENSSIGINFSMRAGNYAANNIFKNIRGHGIWAGDFINAASYSSINNVILLFSSDANGIRHEGGGSHNILNNIILHSDPEISSSAGIYMIWTGKSYVQNNLVAGFHEQLSTEEMPLDSTFIINNIFGYSDSEITFQGLINLNYADIKVVRNNIFLKHIGGAVYVRHGTLKPDYNLYWNVGKNYSGNIIPGANEITADPMFVNDTFPTLSGNYDFHLQKYSPAIDKGDPSILDVDGSRSDIGMFGGPLGERYEYEDYAPKAPKGLMLEIDSSSIYLNWKRNREADFSHYVLYSDTTASFHHDSTNLVASITDTSFVLPIPQHVTRVYYKLTAADSQNNHSAPGDEVGVVLTGVKEEGRIIQDYSLYQNYPNPFNPRTRIPYRLKSRGYVKLSVYDIKGELIKTVVNEIKEAGYYEAEFHGSGTNPYPFSPINQLASGIYLYRLEVISEGNIPVYSDMKKMVLLK